MIHLLTSIPFQFILACSGGVDSMAAADFFRRGKKNFKLAYFHHSTPQADEMMKVVKRYGYLYAIDVEVGYLQTDPPKGQSREMFWREQRYAWLLSLNMPVITCHHLNDVVETWIFSSLHGQPKLIPAINGNVLRPFLLNEKQELIDWCQKHNVKWHEDASNADVRFPRNRIRHVILPECLKINPGLAKVLRKKLLKENEHAR
jgi:tRNA(Ile)-lysidine synthase